MTVSKSAPRINHNQRVLNPFAWIEQRAECERRSLNFTHHGGLPLGGRGNTRLQRRGGSSTSPFNTSKPKFPGQADRQAQKHRSGPRLSMNSSSYVWQIPWPSDIYIDLVGQIPQVDETLHYQEQSGTKVSIIEKGAQQPDHQYPEENQPPLL